MTPKPVDDLGRETVFMKLGKSVVAGCDLKVNELLTLDNLSGKIFGEQYIPVRETNRILGKTVNREIKKGDLIKYEDVS